MECGQDPVESRRLRVRGIEEDEVEGAGRGDLGEALGLEGVTGQYGGALRESQRVGAPPKSHRGPAIALHQDRMGGATAERLECQRAGSSEEVEDSGLVEGIPRLKRRVQSLAHTLGGRARALTDRHLEAAAREDTTDDADSSQIGSELKMGGDTRLAPAEHRRELEAAPLCVVVVVASQPGEE